MTFKELKEILKLGYWKWKPLPESIVHSFKWVATRGFKKRRTKVSFEFFTPRIYGIHKNQLPWFEMRAGDDQAMRYGYPRHHVYLVIWWNHKGRVLGLEFTDRHQE